MGVEMMPPPDYRGGGIVNLTASLILARGGEERLYPPLSCIDRDMLADAGNIVLVVIDGLGYEYLLRNGRSGVLRSHLKGRMTSVFPSTTATAITTFLTGTAPQQHGITGWFMYVRQMDGILAVLPFTQRGSTPASVPDVDPRELFVQPPLFDRIPGPCYEVIPDRIADSRYNAAHRGAAITVPYRSMAQFIGGIERAVRTDTRRKFVYAYWPDLDGLGHDHGIGSRRVAVHFAQLDYALERLTASLKGSHTTLIVTADHGMIDTTPERVIEVGDHPEMAQALIRPLCGERRSAYCYVDPTRAQRFEDYVRDALADRATLVGSDDLVAGGYFGLGEPHPALRERIGDYTLLMKDNYVIKDWVPGERYHVHLGVHGGLSAEEMNVPLIVIDTDAP
jgi:hypothetical protein